MTNKTITLHRCRVQVVEVPECAKDFKVFKFQDKYWHFDYKLSEWETVGMAFLYKDFGGKAKYPKSLQLVGVWPEITEEQAAMVVREYGIGMFLNYNNKSGHKMFALFGTAIESLRSLLTSNNLDPNKRWVVLIDKK